MRIASFPTAKDAAPTPFDIRQYGLSVTIEALQPLPVHKIIGSERYFGAHKE